MHSNRHPVVSADSLAYIKIACRELQQFSIPGVGTFVRELQPSRFDPERKLLYPPHETIKLISGKFAFANEFKQFLQNSQGMSADQAQELMEQIGEQMIVELKRTYKIDIPAFGRIARNADGTYSLEVDAQDPTLQSFGLNPVAYQEAARRPIKPLKTETKTAKSKPENEAKSKPNAAPQKANLNLYFLGVGFLLLFIILGLLIYDYRDELKTYFNLKSAPEAIAPAEIEVEPLPTESEEGKDFNNAVFYSKKALADSIALVDSLKADSMAKTKMKRKRKK